MRQVDERRKAYIDKLFTRASSLSQAGEDDRSVTVLNHAAELCVAYSETYTDKIERLKDDLAGEGHDFIGAGDDPQ